MARQACACVSPPVLGVGLRGRLPPINVGRCDPSNSPISAKPLPADRVDQTGLDGL